MSKPGQNMPLSMEPYKVDWDSASKAVPKIIIVGAGLSALCLAQALIHHRTHKFDVTVYERDDGPKARWQGHHFMLRHTGAKALVSCLPRDRLASFAYAVPNTFEGERCTSGIINDVRRRVTTVWNMDNPRDLWELASCKGHAWMVAFRPQMRELLCRDVDIKWGRRFVGYEETEDQVHVRFDDGSIKTCDLLVGCDGLRSSVRQQRFPLPDNFIHDLGVQIMIVEIPVPVSLMDSLQVLLGGGQFGVCHGPGGHAIFIIMRRLPIVHDGETFFKITWAYERPSEEGDRNEMPAEIKRTIAEAIRRWPPSLITDLLAEVWSLASTCEEETRGIVPFVGMHWRLSYDVDVDKFEKQAWDNSGRVTLMGDAAHAMSASRAEGANQAFQDAALLACELEHYDTDGWAACVKRYEEKMRKRAFFKLRESRFASYIHHIHVNGPITRFSRDALFIVLSAVENTTSLLMWAWGRLGQAVHGAK